MRYRHSFKYHIFIFVAVQMAWLILLGLWIYWYISSYMLINEMGEKFSPQLNFAAHNLLALIGGLILLVAIAVGMSLLFHRLSVQFKMSQLYDNFIANVTHELKSPLAAIQLHLETLQARDLSRKEYKPFVDMMLEDCNRLSDLISAILKIPALEQKQIAHAFEVVNMQDLIEDMVGELIEQFKLSPGAVVLSGQACCQCVVDRKALRIVLDNLVDNSIKYSDGPVQISITVSCDKSRFVLNYTDRGIGVPRSEAKYVFDKFYRINRSDAANIKGTGLGLYWAKQIMRYHGGDICVAPRYWSKGASFRLELPRYPTRKKRYLKGLIKMSQRLKAREAENGGD
jgi:signal transduction histidine kinase